MTTNHTLSGAWPKRKGVILLLVLAMMTFFAILVAAFMVISSQQYREAATNRKIGEFVQSPRDDLHAAILELIVGSNDSTTSDIWEHSLGATLYGDIDFSTYPWIHGTIPSDATVDTIQSDLLWLDLDTGTPIPRNEIQYAGNVITLRNNTSSDKWKSTRIVDFGYNASGDIVSVLVQPIANFTLADYRTADYYINGPAFGGTGTDYNLDYTAPDNNNPFLAWMDLSSSPFSVLPSFSDIVGTNIIVDNDGDGIPDGGWVQTSLPVRSTKDGSQYRPMFSFLVLDLDGRLNFNAHGNWLQARTDGEYDIPSNLLIDDTQNDIDYTQDDIGLLSGDVPGIITPSVLRGSGYGPAAVRLDYGLAQLLNNSISDGRTILDNLLGGNTVNSINYPGRYGSGTDPQPGRDGLKEKDIADLQFAGVPQNGSSIASGMAYDGSTGVAYGGTPPDFWEDLAVIYDPLGHRSFWPKEGWLNNSNWASISTDNPYEFTVNQKTPYDEPFTLPELEAVLRMNDLDQKNLSPRLKELLGLSNLATSNLRYNVTTISNSVPKMPTFTYQELDTTSTPPTYTTKTGNLRELIANCVSRSGGTGDVDTLMSYLINTYNLTADDRVQRPYLTESGRLDVNALLTDPDVLPTSTNRYTGLAKRMDFARAVYILLMALSYDQIYNDTTVVNLDPNYARDEYLNTLTGTARADACRELTAIRLAQWAVNLVDFMDPDATMTPFVFDVNPFNGWNATHDYLTDITDGTTLRTAINASGTHLVWGLEPSDLLITETFAFHDRRVANTKAYRGTETEDKYKYVYDIEFPTDSGYNSTEAAKYDKRFDQVRIPEGSAFIELYNAGNPNRPSYPSPMYDSTGRLNLNAETPVGTGSVPAYPVWRLVVGESTDPMYGRPRNNFNGDPLGTYTPSTNPRIRVLDTATSEIISIGRENNIVYKNMQYPATFSFQPEQYYDESVSGSRMRGSLLGANALAGFQDIKIDRIVWLHNNLSPASHKDSNRIFHNVEGTTTLGPNEYLIVGPRAKTAIGAQNHTTGNYGYPATRKLELDKQTLPTGVSSAKYICAAMVTNPMTTDPDTTDPDAKLKPWSRTARIGFNISEPMPNSGFYYDEPEYFNLGNASVRDCYASNMKDPSTCKPEPMDALTSPSDYSHRPVADDHLVFQDGTAPLYKSLFLQRVADPDRPYDEITNPYISVDWAMFDLTVFNGERSPEDERYAVAYDNVMMPFLDTPPAEGTVFVSRQWGHKDMMPASQYPALPNPRARYLAPLHSGSIFQMELKLPSGAGVQPNFNATSFYDFFKKNGHTTLGYLNEMALSDGSAVTPRTDTGLYNGAPSMPFLHLPWNDAPLANSYEVMQVPASSPGRLGIEFIDQENTAGVKKTYKAVSFGTDGRFAHLLNFFSQVNEPDILADPGSGTDAVPGRSALNLAPLLDCVYIPSRFLGTRDWYNLDNLSNAYSVSRYREPGLINLNTMTEATFHALMGGRTTVSYADFDTTRTTNRFRGLSSNDVKESLLREGSTGYPLFAGDYSSDMNGLGANTYNMLEGLQRLSSMTTTTSNTFAVWVTLGYFERVQIEEPANSDTYVWRWRELGRETGEITRHRAFYILDRSIPFGYSRGKKLNAEDIILLRRFIE